ncbi:MAG TPA: hypothetical protein PLD47_08905 [Aggregatilineales bacterium]|nr:hypothetical protein [Anaerolineales bacterium]HRE47832.1 hypothetical protein [Aggregatilineales bacterium]
MDRTTSAPVSRGEWRWVIIVGGLLVTLSLLPYLWALNGVQTEGSYAFTGVLYNPLDAATYLAKIRQGINGNWLMSLPHTSEPHAPALIQVYYVFLGQIARLLSMSPIVIYQLTRLVGAFFMYLAMYHLGATIWTRKRERRLFFAIMGMGSGLGWLGLLLTAARTAPATDFTIPESIPFHAALVNAHFAFSIALIMIAAAVFVRVFRPGHDEQPTLTNGGGTLIMIALILIVIQPQAWLPMAATLGAYSAVLTIRGRGVPLREINWALLFILPALPFLIYYVAILSTNEAMRLWNEQNQTPSPGVINYILGFGLPLLVGIPSIWRAFRRFERDGDRFMVTWLIVNAALLYAPFNLQRRLAIGLFIPISYFAVRALRDYWFTRIPARWRGATLIALIVFMIPSNILVWGLPLVGILQPEQGLEGSLLIYRDEAQAIAWLAANGNAGEIVLASPRVSLYIPVYSDLKVVYSHPYETLRAAEKLVWVKGWLEGIYCPPKTSDHDEPTCMPMPPEACRTVLERYNVRYVLLRAADASSETTGATSRTACLEVVGLTTPIQRIGMIAIYRVP